MRIFLLGLLVSTAAAAQSAPNVTNIKAIHHDGQTFVTWADVSTGADGANYRYNIYRSLAPITDATLSNATLIQAAVFNNSGQLTAQFPYTQATRQDVTKLMAVIEQGPCGTKGAYTVCGAPLAPFTGLAVHTALNAESAYYAVITTDITHVRRDSPVAPGANATPSPIAEIPAPIQPIKYYDSADTKHRIDVPDTVLTGRQGLPLRFSLHASGGLGGCGAAQVFGDYWQMWGDASMGYQEGIPRVFSVWEANDVRTYGERTLVLRPCDTAWTSDGLGLLETFWFGYLGTQLGDTGQWALPITESALGPILQWTIGHYNVDTNRIYGIGQSMGGWGTSTWSLRHPEIFTAIFPAMPRWEETAIPNMVKKVSDKATSATLMVDRKTQYIARQNSVDYVKQHCGDALPFIGWGIGRQDGYATWQEQVDMLNALKSCRLGFAFNWNNGGHGDGPAAAAVVSGQYGAKFAKNVSYPAFTNSTIDDNPGTGDPALGDLQGCINCGFVWTNIQDTADLWSVDLSNTKNPGTMRVDVTPRNLQAYHILPSSAVAWYTSKGQMGTVLADAFGLVTANGVELASSGPVTVSFRVLSKLPPRKK